MCEQNGQHSFCFSHFIILHLCRRNPIGFWLTTKLITYFFLYIVQKWNIWTKYASKADHLKRQLSLEHNDSIIKWVVLIHLHKIQQFEMLWNPKCDTHYLITKMFNFQFISQFVIELWHKFHVWIYTRILNVPQILTHVKIIRWTSIQKCS